MCLSTATKTRASWTLSGCTPNQLSRKGSTSGVRPEPILTSKGRTSPVRRGPRIFATRGDSHLREFLRRETARTVRPRALWKLVAASQAAIANMI